VSLPLFDEWNQDHARRLAAYDQQQAAQLGSGNRTSWSGGVPVQSIEGSADSTITQTEEFNALIFGKEDAITAAEIAIRAAVTDGRCTADVKLDGLETIGSNFDVALVELSVFLQNMHVEIVFYTARTWELRLQAMGKMTLHEARRVVDRYENQKMKDHNKIPLPPTWTPMTVKTFLTQC
jgi:hypothetical protein